jgi:hypothetical protein
MVATALAERISATPFVDTHEHLLEERTRLAGVGAHRMLPCLDAALLFAHYAKDDLWSSGMTAEESERIFSPEVAPGDKWPLLEPYWRRCRQTGYLRAVAETIRILFEVEELDRASFEAVSAAMATRARPGLYREVLGRAGVEVAQVNSMERPFCESEYPDLLQQDLSLVNLSTAVSPEIVEGWSGMSGLTVGGLADWHRMIDWAFETYGRRADAVKSQAAYQRRLDYQPVAADEAGPYVERMLRGQPLAAAER